MCPEKKNFRLITTSEVFKAVGVKSKREQSLAINTISYLLGLLSREEAGTKLHFSIFEIHKIDENTFSVMHVPTETLMEEAIHRLADEGWAKE